MLRKFIKRFKVNKRKKNLNRDNQFLPQHIISNKDRAVNLHAKNQKIAICLHIFYEDFIGIFINYLKTFPSSFDLFCTIKEESYRKKIEKKCKSIKNLNHTQITVVPNRGRNFGPLLVEYGKTLSSYDLMCHLHSKKSLYSGKDQKQWANYLIDHLLNPHIVKNVVNIFTNLPKMGLYSPINFDKLPGWVNSWGKNKSVAIELANQLEVHLKSNFINYPVGGMFWVRPKAIDQLLRHSFQYTDFPKEPLPADGTLAHTIERMMGYLVEANEYQPFYYVAHSKQYTQEKGYFFNHYREGVDRLLGSLKGYAIVGFDLFDTLARRRYFFPDYAKLQLGSLLHKKNLVRSAEAFVKLRNEVENEIRKQRNKSDVCITEVYTKLAAHFHITVEEALQYMQREFEYDLENLLPKDEMVDLFNALAAENRKLWIISDTYYTPDQIHLILKKIGITAPYKLFVSSEQKKRKDTGEMWRHLKKQYLRDKNQFIHIGDNVVSDAQVPGDLGLNYKHILNPYDKWSLLGMPWVPEYTLDEAVILKWGKLISCIGRNPFLGEL